ncbi:MAG: twin-arginine translocase subunit TatC, partial [Nitrososphaerales archaeon]
MAQGVLGRLGLRHRGGGFPVPPDERRMTVTGHLQELRRVLIVSLIAWVIGTGVAAVFTEKLIGLLENPLRTVLAHQTSHLISGIKLTGPIVTSPTELFTIPLKVALMGGLVLSLPIVLWQVWT